MNYCVNCNLNLGDNVELNEKEGKSYCPNCDNEMMTITNNKLVTLLNDINQSFTNLKESKNLNDAQELIKHAKVIQTSEKKIRKEYNKRIEMLDQINYELEVIQKIADGVNYNLKGGE